MPERVISSQSQSECSSVDCFSRDKVLVGIYAKYFTIKLKFAKLYVGTNKQRRCLLKICITLRFKMYSERNILTVSFAIMNN